MSGIARCKWAGKEFRAEHIEDLPDGRMRMRALDKGDRFVEGSILAVGEAEVREWITPKVVEEE